MDERDYKAMNEELKSAEYIIDTNVVLAEVCAIGNDLYAGNTVYLNIKEAIEEYASQFQKQLKEKEEEIEMLNSELQRKFIQWENQKQTIKNYQEVVTKHFPAVYACSENLDEELTKSNEMNERLAESLRKLSSQEHIEQDLYIRFTKDAFDILEQYQKSKK